MSVKIFCVALVICFCSRGILGDDDCAGESQGLGDFDTPSLKGKKCSDLNRDYCIFTSETKSKCPCICKKLVYGNGGGGGGGGGGSGSGSGGEDQEEIKTTAAPTKCKGKKCKGKKFCFHADDLVTTEDGQMITMKDLASNPELRVQTGDHFSPVRYWLHAEEQTKANFLEITTASGHRLHISSEHLIYRSITCRQTQIDTVFARKLRPGHCLHVSSSQSGDFTLTPITHISNTNLTGIYAPITDHGSIVVNGVLASCYTNFENEKIQKFIYGILLDARDFLARSKILGWMGEWVFGDRSDQGTAEIPAFVYSLMDLAKYFVHA